MINDLERLQKRFASRYKEREEIQRIEHEKNNKEIAALLELSHLRTPSRPSESVHPEEVLIRDETILNLLQQRDGLSLICASATQALRRRTEIRNALRQTANTYGLALGEAPTFDIDSVTHNLIFDGDNVREVTNVNRLTLHTFTLSALAYVRYSEIGPGVYDVFQRAVQRLSDVFTVEEESSLFRCLNHIPVREEVSLAELNIRIHNLFQDRFVLCNPRFYDRILSHNLIPTPQCPTASDVFIISPGAVNLVVRSEPEIRGVEVPENLSYSLTVWEQIGLFLRLDDGRVPMIIRYTIKEE